MHIGPLAKADLLDFALEVIVIYHTPNESSYV